MAKSARLFASPLVAVERIEHPDRPSSGDAGDDRSEHYSINFIRRGTFALTVRKSRWTIGSQDVFVTMPGMEYRCREVERPESECAGVCFDVRFSPSVPDICGWAVEALGSHVPVVAMNNRRAYLRRR